MKRLEAICDAIAAYHHYGDPESEAYTLRNPGLLQGEVGKKEFSCHKAGYAALFDRVLKHCRANPEQRTVVMLEHFGIKMKLQQENAIDFMSRCANSNALSLATSLKWFLEQ